MQKELMRTYKDCRCIRDVYQILNGYAAINNRKAIDKFIQEWIKDCSKDTVWGNLRYIWRNGLSEKFCRIFDLKTLKTKPSFIQKILNLLMSL
jgi:hypothetical protein